MGAQLIEKIDDEPTFLALFQERDFKGRTLTDIISKNGFDKLMLDDNMNNLLNTIWRGEDFTKCDGVVSDYSLLTYLWKYPSKVTGKTISTKTIVENNYTPNINLTSFTYQYKFRKFSINFLYWEDFLFALFMCGLFQYTNFQYLELFNSENFNDMTTAEKEAAIQTSIDTYQSDSLASMILTGILIMQLVLKACFNILSKRKLPADKWTVGDLIFVLVNMSALNVVSNLQPQSFMTVEDKTSIDYYMIAVVVFSWIRFFMMFLLNKHISPLLAVVGKMIKSTTSFMLIVCCFLVISASIFMTLYMDLAPEKFGTFPRSFRTMFDAMLGTYDYAGMDSREISYSILLLGHLFLSTILLLNYLIAILSTVYEVMQEYGDFSYKSNVFYYCQKYIIPLSDGAYGELAYNPAPLSVCALFILPFACW